MKNVVTVDTVHTHTHTHTHTQANLENIKINKVKRDFSLYINVYKTDQLVI